MVSTSEVRITIPYCPRPQFIPYHERLERWAVIVAHRRFGKTVGCINELNKQAIICSKENGRYAYIAPFYSQAKDVAWGYVKQYGLVVPGAEAHESELRIDYPNGARLRLYGADNYDRMRGLYFDEVILDEYGDMDPRAWSDVIRPALSDRQGKATFIGTPRGQNHFATIWDDAQNNPEWFKLMLKASQTVILPETELVDARRQMTAEQYAAEYECSFYGAVIGSYYGREIEWLEAQSYISAAVNWEPDTAVHTAWDVGGTTAIWFFQIIDGLIRIIEYLEGHNQSAGWYASKLRERPYNYGTHIVPSDANDEKEIVGISWVDSLAKMDMHNFHILPKQTSIDNGINAARMMLSKCRFAKEKTADGTKALRNYRREWDDKRKTFRDHPLHDWSSHAADAFRHLALGHKSVGNPSWSAPLNYPEAKVI